MDNSIIQIINLSKNYSNSPGIYFWKKEEKQVLKNVSLSIKKGDVFALVGESGSGKTTLGKCVLKFTQPNSGKILYEGADLTKLHENNFKPIRKKIQMIFQNPQQALNPKQTVGACIMEVLKKHEKTSRETNQKRLLELLKLVQLSEDVTLKYPFELSGGQQQRLVIARALSTRPNFIIADEPTSSLDAIIKMQIIDLFKKLQKKLNLTILFISHDLAIVSKIANSIGVIYKGEIVEQAPIEELLKFPVHPYSRLLLKSARIERNQQGSFKAQIALTNVNSCSFVDRCPIRKKLCYSSIPEITEINSSHKVRCHFRMPLIPKESSKLTQLVGV